jgi:pimeloyl-ACP methyl ester carboxylesterase
MCHGFPELAYTWRHQLAALAEAGYHAVAPDMRGFGATGGPPETDAYDQPHVEGDMVGLLDALGVEKAIFLGHDWGGAIVWGMGLRHSERTAGVIGLNTPMFPRGEGDFLEQLAVVKGPSNYMLAFQEPGRAEAVLEADVEHTFRSMLRRPGLLLEELPPELQALPMSILVGDPPIFGEEILTEEELSVYVEAYRRTGFTGGLNWYRNIHRSWELSAGQPTNVMVPSLMISATNDIFLPTVLSEGMEQHVPDLEKHLIHDCGHWVQHEKPEEVNRLILNWLRRRFPV